MAKKLKFSVKFNQVKLHHFKPQNVHLKKINHKYEIKPQKRRLRSEWANFKIVQNFQYQVLRTNLNHSQIIA